MIDFMTCLNDRSRMTRRCWCLTPPRTRKRICNPQPENGLYFSRLASIKKQLLRLSLLALETLLTAIAPIRTGQRRPPPIPDEETTANPFFAIGAGEIYRMSVISCQTYLCGGNGLIVRRLSMNFGMILFAHDHAPIRQAIGFSDDR